MSTMTTLPRQPFAPLDGARLQNLTSLKNRQNAFVPSGGKRKAETIENDDSENVDPGLFSKRSKGSDGFASAKDCFKPSSFVLTKAASTPSFPKASSPSVFASAPRAIARPRSTLLPKSPAAKLNTALASSALSLSAPAGRSPTRAGKRVGIFSNRRRNTGSPFTRVEPPAFGLGGSAGAPFSLDAALKGTISSYASRSTVELASSSSSLPLGGGSSSLYDSELDSSWVFDIHEDTPEQEMTNLLQHSTCVLDISSDEESEQKMTRERAEGRDKENIPPADDVSQTTSASRGRRVDENDMVFEKARGPLMEMNAEDYYAEGCDELSVIIVPGDEDCETDIEGEVADEKTAIPAVITADEVVATIADESFEFAPEPTPAPNVDDIMGRRDESAPKAALLEPIEGTGESFELWESASAKDPMSGPPSPSPAAAVEEVEVEVAAALAAEVVA